MVFSLGCQFRCWAMVYGENTNSHLAHIAPLIFLIINKIKLWQKVIHLNF